ncbi:hypothetical protein NEOLEDRAFT_1141789 [Neolentinus lepideus HHB14362 ss-1]|uniref:Uncharacterized protein n=1 Tax=Neolentinus lepideus HHB14362 ss-1 TaxID=1314782 RepID=A0A165NHQ8_9AGAM|nr:hypothetical protein NEOLEDRAFT_1141789 [Neolentinus lepideus HHB14362 ss-1]
MGSSICRSGASRLVSSVSSLAQSTPLTSRLRTTCHGPLDCQTHSPPSSGGFMYAFARIVTSFIVAHVIRQSAARHVLLVPFPGSRLCPLFFYLPPSIPTHSSIPGCLVVNPHSSVPSRPVPNPLYAQ